MKRNTIVRVLKLLPFGVVAVTVVGFVVMSLWNWLLPPLFGWKQIGFWQAVGIFILSKLLFGGFAGGGHGGSYSRRGMMERWAQMTPEERERFREGLRMRCGGVEPPEPRPVP